MHRDADLLDAKAAREQAPIRIEATGVDSRDEPPHPGARGEGLACVEESLEPVRRARARTNRRDLDVAGVAPRFAPGAAVTDSHAVEPVVAGEDECVADPLRRHSDDLALEVETAKDGVRELANLVQQRGSAVRDLRRGERVPAVGIRGGRLGGHHRETAGPEAVSLVEAQVLGARREGEEPGLPHAPAFERLQDRLEQPARDATIPEVGMDGERAEEAERAPAGCEHRSHDGAVDLGYPCAIRRGAKPVLA